MDNLAPCSHKEADTRLLVHALDARLTGHRRVKIKSNDKDVVVLAISVAHEIEADQLWLKCGSGKTLRLLPIHSIAQSLSREKPTALPLLHALTGCDTVSCFAGRGKKTVWVAWKVFSELTQALNACTLSRESSDITDHCLETIERFVVIFTIFAIEKFYLIIKLHFNQQVCGHLL